MVTHNPAASQPAAADPIPDDWEALADYGRALAQANDRNRWLLGDAARKVEKRYGESALEQYASDIGVYPRTLRTYRQVSAFYAENGTRELFPNLSWQHYRACVRLGDLETALDMLDTCSANNWSTRDLTDALNAALGKPPVKRPIVETEVVATAAGVVVNDALLVPGVTYLIKVYAL